MTMKTMGSLLRKTVPLAAFALFSGSAVSASDSTTLFNTQLMDSDGKPVVLERYRGQPLIVNFWARICMPCRTELPEMNALYSKYRDKGLTVVGIAVEDETESIRDFAKAYNLDYPMVHGKDAGIQMMMALDNKIAGLPFTVVVDREGRIVQQKMGGMTPEDIQSALAKILP